MTPIEVYKTYLAFKNHFTKPNYDYFQYCGKSRASTESFNKRKDKYFFERMSRQKSDEEIKQYFACSTISSFKLNFECKRPYLNIIRSILRQQSYIIVGNDIEMKLEAGIYKRTMKYTISRGF